MKIKLSKSQWEAIGSKGGWLRTAKIGTDDVNQILAHVKEIWKLMDNLQGVYKFIPERNGLMALQKGMENILKYSEASSEDVVKVADEGSSQTMPLDGVQNAPDSQAKFKKKKKDKKTLQK